MPFSKDNTTISKCLFNDLHDSVGGAIKVILTRSHAEIHYCLFKACCSLSYRPSSGRNKPNPSGGACYYDVFTLNMSFIYTTYCKAAGLGHALYISLSEDTSIKSFFHCIADSFSGQDVIYGTYSSVNAVDKGRCDYTDLNCTHARSTNNVGVFHFGSRPTFRTSKYCNIVFDEEYTSTAIGFSALTKCNNIAQYYHIENSKSDSILCFWGGNHYLSNFYFVKCYGTLISYVGDVDSIMIKNSYLDPSINSNFASFSSCTTKTDSYLDFNKCPFIWFSNVQFEKFNIRISNSLFRILLSNH